MADFTKIAQAIAEFSKDNKYILGNPDKNLAYPIENMQDWMAELLKEQYLSANLNGLSTFYTENSYLLFWESMKKISCELLGLKDSSGFGVISSQSATYSILQGITAALSSDYGSFCRRSLAEDGIPKAVSEGYDFVFLAPISAKFIFEKISKIMFFGSDRIIYYGLDRKTFEPDLNDLETKLKELSKKRVAATLIFGGDGERGVAHTNGRDILSLIEKHQNSRPKLIVDASSEWDTHLAQGITGKYDFSNNYVDMIVIDIQKQGGPYPGSFLLVKDANIIKPNYETRQHLLQRESIFSSKDLAPELVVYFIVNFIGLDYFLKAGEYKATLTGKIKERIGDSSFLENYTSGGRRVAYGVRSGYSIANRKLAEIMNLGKSKNGYLMTGYDYVRACQEGQIGNQNFDGLFGTVTSRHTKNGLFAFIRGVESIVKSYI